MSIAQSLIGELQFELAKTREVLQTVPEEHFGWKPHEKSYTLGALAGHIAEMVDWIPFTLDTTELDFSKESYNPKVYTKVSELLEVFDKNVKATYERLENAKDEEFFPVWTMRDGEQIFFSMPRIQVLRSMVINHLVHHRAQLGVYLRLLNVPLIGIYGPTADEQMAVMS